MKYKSKPVVIEAMQYIDLLSLNKMIAQWPGFVDQIVKPLVIKTLEGDMTAHPGDWIIKGTMGEFYPCKDEVFQRKYEPVE